MPSDDQISKEINDTEKLNAVEKYKTARKKVEFISEIKSGLGKEIKKNPNSVKIIKKSLGERINSFFKKLFTKF